MDRPYTDESKRHVAVLAGAHVSPDFMTADSIQLPMTVPDLDDT